MGQARRLVLRAERGSAGALRPISQSGLESTEVCVWVIAEPLTERDAWAALGAAVSPRDLDRYRADRRIEMLQSQAWYFIRDSPDLQKVARGCEAKND